MVKPTKTSGPIRTITGKKWQVENKGKAHYCKTEKSAWKYIRKKGW